MKPFEKEFSTVNELWATLIVEELFRCGVKHFCICPGSRSTPLTLAAASHKGVKTTVHYDERGMAYFALGLAKTERLAPAIITTSGSAVANLFPATVEAFQSRHPLLLLTADRPPELLDTGANQAIDQTKIFEGHVKWATTLPCPTLEIAPSMVLTTLDQAVFQCTQAPPGPVHLNFMFREPFLAEETQTYENYLSSLHDWRGSQTPFTRYFQKQAVVLQEDWSQWVKNQNASQKKLIIAGGLQSLEESRAVLKLASALNCPIFPDITSQLRLCDSPHLIPYYDLLLLQPTFQKTLAEVESVLQFGGHLTSKRLLHFLKTHSALHWTVVANHPWRDDPVHRVAARIEADLRWFCENLAHTKFSHVQNDPWWEGFKVLSEQLQKDVAAYFSASSELTEPGVAYVLAENLPPRSQLFLGNSLPIRLMEMFAAPQKFPPEIQANRGASGIEGLLATATGYAVGAGKPTVLLVGDLSFLHDMNSLNLMRSLKVPLVGVVLNNDGGGIFSLLPIHQQRKFYKPYFQTPHGLEFQAVCQMFGIDYVNPPTLEAFQEAFCSALQQNQATLIEVHTHPEDLHRILAHFSKKGTHLQESALQSA